MTRVQISLDKKELGTLRHEAEESGKIYSQLVREAINNIYVSRFSNKEMARMAKEAKGGKGLRKFKNLQVARGYLWSL